MMLAVGRCLSVRPSVTFVNCIETTQDIVNLFRDLVAPSVVTQFQSKPPFVGGNWQVLGFGFSSCLFMPPGLVGSDCSGGQDESEAGRLSHELATLKLTSFQLPAD